MDFNSNMNKGYTNYPRQNFPLSQQQNAQMPQMNYGYPPQQAGYNSYNSYIPQQTQFPSQQIPTQQIPTQQFPTQQIPNQQIPNQQIPNQQIPNQQIPNQQMPNYQYPSYGFNMTDNPALNMGLDIGKQYVEKQLQTVIPGVSTYWNNLKFYFQVSNKYVINKLMVILFPFKTRTWRRLGSTERDAQGNMIVKYEPPRSDINCPDLYIPFLSLVTFSLILSFLAGTKGTFSPEFLKSSLTTSFILINIEVWVIRAIIYFMSSTCSIADLYALCLYKFVGLTVNALCRCLIGKYAYYISFLYTGIAMMIFMLKSITHLFTLQSEETRQVRQKKNYFIFFISVSQLLLMWFMGRYAISN